MNLKVFFRATVFDTAPNINFTEAITELGICYSYSAVMARYLPVRKNAPFEPYEPPQCNFLNSLCYARVEDLPGPIKVCGQCERRLSENPVTEDSGKFGECANLGKIEGKKEKKVPPKLEVTWYCGKSRGITGYFTLG